MRVDISIRAFDGRPAGDATTGCKSCWTGGDTLRPCDSMHDRRSSGTLIDMCRRAGLPRGEAIRTRDGGSLASRVTGRMHPAVGWQSEEAIEFAAVQIAAVTTGSERAGVKRVGVITANAAEATGTVTSSIDTAGMVATGLKSTSVVAARVKSAGVKTPGMKATESAAAKTTESAAGSVDRNHSEQRHRQTKLNDCFHDVLP